MSRSRRRGTPAACLLRLLLGIVACALGGLRHLLLLHGGGDRGLGILFGGRVAARSRGRLGGRPAKLSTEQVALARSRYAAEDATVAEIAKALGV
jgi:hypothetical protein